MSIAVEARMPETTAADFDDAMRHALAPVVGLLTGGSVPNESQTAATLRDNPGLVGALTGLTGEQRMFHRPPVAPTEPESEADYYLALKPSPEEGLSPLRPSRRRVRPHDGEATLQTVSTGFLGYARPWMLIGVL